MSDFGKLMLLLVLSVVGFSLTITMQTQDVAADMYKPTSGTVLSATTVKVSGARTDPSTNLAAASETDTTTSGMCSTQRPYITPSSVELATAADGLTIMRDPTYTYDISGQTVSELRKSVRNCDIRQSIASNYHAITARNIVWSYAAAQEGAICRLRNVRVGLHLAQFMPSLADPANTPAPTLRTWNTYQTNLTGHEEGHVDNAERYAAQIATDLTNMSAPTCDDLLSQVSLRVNTNLILLNNADELYDSQTNHGATQGAVL